MECNRDEATRAKEIAEKKFAANDVSGAKRFALKAQTLYPDLKDLSQMLAMLDVHLSAENKIDGEVDWYGILGVDRSADNETIKKQYRKLALMIHSDKNKSAGADEAFRLIWKAQDLLLDNCKRIAYDQKRFPKTFQQHNHVPTAAAATAASGMGDSSTTPAQGSTVTSSPPAWLFSQPQGSTVTPSLPAWLFRIGVPVHPPLGCCSPISSNSSSSSSKIHPQQQPCQSPVQVGGINGLVCF